MNKSETKMGFGVFGKAYEYMFKNDLHHKRSVDHAILKNMILLDKDSKSFLYKLPQLVHKIYSSKINYSKQLDYIASLYNLAAISEYDISKKHNYQTSEPNAYYLKMMNLNQDGTWQMNEDKLE